MAWFVAHAIFYVKLKEGIQHEFPVWENIFLIAASSREDAFDKAERIGREFEADTREMTYDHQPALHLFKGIRKITGNVKGVRCLRLEDGEEISYSGFEVPSEADVDRLVAGEEVQVLYTD